MNGPHRHHHRGGGRRFPGYVGPVYVLEAPVVIQNDDDETEAERAERLKKRKKAAMSFRGGLFGLSALSAQMDSLAEFSDHFWRNVITQQERNALRTQENVDTLQGAIAVDFRNQDGSYTQARQYLEVRKNLWDRAVASGKNDAYFEGTFKNPLRWTNQPWFWPTIAVGAVGLFVLALGKK